MTDFGTDLEPEYWDEEPPVEFEFDDASIYPPDDDICLNCDGTGTKNGHLCKTCQGLGLS